MRKSRISPVAETIYHVTSRIYQDTFRLKSDEEKSLLLTTMRDVARFSGIDILAFTIMDNHFHLLINVPKYRSVGDEELKERIVFLYGKEKADKKIEQWAVWSKTGLEHRAEAEKEALRIRLYNLSDFVKTFKEHFTRSYNTKYKHEGQFWGGTRFKSMVVARKADVVNLLAAYIDLNCVRAKIVHHPNEYLWCGLGAAKKGNAEALAELRQLLSVEEKFTGSDPVKAFEEILEEMRTRDEKAEGKVDTEKLEKLGIKATVASRGIVRYETPKEMWVRRMKNLIDGGIIGPVEYFLEFNSFVRSHWRPSGFGENAYTRIKARNAKVR